MPANTRIFQAEIAFHLSSASRAAAADRAARGLPD
jgi:hypothetical protein